MFCNFYPSSMNSLDFFTLQGSIFCIFDLLGMNFGNFHPWGWILCNFFSLRWILCNFYPLRLNSLQFLPFKGEIFASFTFLRFFWGEKDKKLLLYWWIFWNFYFFTLRGWIFCIFSSLKGEFFQIFALQGWIICIFHPYRMNSLQFSFLRVISF